MGLRVFTSCLAIACTTAGVAAQQAPAPRAEAGIADRVTVTGCVVRQTGDGAALSANAEGNLVLTKAVVATAQRNRPASAVPGSSPSGSDSGTIPVRPVSPTPENGSPLADKSFDLVGPSASRLAGLIGQRVEIIGTLVREEKPATVATTGGAGRQGGAGSRAEAGAPSVAHPSAPVERVTVMTFRAIGGGCT